MNEKEIVKIIMKKTNTTQGDLQRKLGLKSQASISSYLKTDAMKVDKLVDLLNAMGGKLIIHTDDEEWEVRPSVLTSDLDSLLS
ncbi:hypothetical protein SAMN05216249_1117 [Acetitomaculum ruminis DSM 5522]|uniref:HTH cro/C1-type domain-containing protein n=1 Tax=Acetitomaculum ruminis DSM 5522 TaxID=1120918 RepID=A0A1I0YQ52_9FIRM|nr:hypothetical protein [Acetitomaculum ruminis]SFB15454.1 hypothetical protein SAMN05216249_1117 [Acetitomaculum ruminis DSM 5522]